jgi:hypothetical protein
MGAYIFAPLAVCTDLLDIGRAQAAVHAYSLQQRQIESIIGKHLARSTAPHPASPSDSTLDVCVTLVEEC